MFCLCTDFNYPLDSWDVSNVTDMSYMFCMCFDFNQPLDSWNVGSVEYMMDMFSHCENFNQPLNSWDVSNVITMDCGTKSSNVLSIIQSFLNLCFVIAIILISH